MPEAGGAHAIYIDPFDTTAVLELCDKLFYDGETLAAAERQLRASFKPQTWREASQDVQKQLAELAARPQPDDAMARRPLVFGHLYKFFNIEAAEAEANSVQVFGNFLDQEAALDLLVGWNWFDLDVNCTWACGPKAEISLVPPPDSSGDLVAYMELIAAPAYDGAECQVSVDGHAAGSFKPVQQARRVLFEIPAPAPGRPISVVFEFPQTKTPTGADTRLLGLGLRTVALFDRADTEGRLGLLESECATKPKRHAT